MAQLIYELNGVRGREMKLYDTKCVITTRKTAGSLLTGNFTDGEKTIFLCDVVGVQFKESGGLIGYLQLETPSMQMNNTSNNMFSENTFTFEDGKNGITNSLMHKVYQYVVDRVEELKYGKAVPCTIGDSSKADVSVQKAKGVAIESAPIATDNMQEHRTEAVLCSESSFVTTDKGTIICSQCNTEQKSNRRVCWNCGANFII